MPRIRSLKPEFWDSPSTAQASLAARLLFLAMWNWADDSGRGTAGLKELEAFAFPNDDVRTFERKISGISGDSPQGTPGHYRSFSEVCGDVSAAYGVQFYRVKNRPYYVIPSFKSHQSKDFRVSSKFPLETEGQIYDVTTGNLIGEPAEVQDSAHEAGNSAHEAGKKNTGTGEQGNRGTGLKDSSSEVAVATPRPDVDHILDLFDERMVANGAKKPARSKKNTDAVRLLIDKDHYTVDQIIWIINWATRHEFWRTNILSPAKLREKFDQLKLKSQSEATKNNVATTIDKMTQTMILAQQMEHGQPEGETQLKVTETGQVLSKIQAFNNRTFDQHSISAWHETIGDLPLADCLQAVGDYFRESKDWIMPADIRSRVRAIRASRVEAIGHNPELRTDDLDVPPAVWKARQQHLMKLICSGDLNRDQYEAYHAHQIDLPGTPKGIKR